jgi:hypothetical protein
VINGLRVLVIMEELTNSKLRINPKFSVQSFLGGK